MDMKSAEGNLLYIDGVLRLASRNDEEWKQVIAPFFAGSISRGRGEETGIRRLFYLRKP